MSVIVLEQKFGAQQHVNKKTYAHPLQMWCILPPPSICFVSIPWFIFNVERKSLCFGMLIKFFNVCSSAGVSNRVNRYSCTLRCIANCRCHRTTISNSGQQIFAVLKASRGRVSYDIYLSRDDSNSQQPTAMCVGWCVLCIFLIFVQFWVVFVVVTMVVTATSSRNFAGWGCLGLFQKGKKKY